MGQMCSPLEKVGERNNCAQRNIIYHISYIVHQNHMGQLCSLDHMASTITVLTGQLASENGTGLSFSSIFGST